MLEYWVTCPFCDDEYEDVYFGGDDEHIIVGCTHCESKVKLYNEDDSTVEMMNDG